jgi:cell division septation protein DedD
MSKTREVRELQFSSTQLIVLFMAILILGVFIFLLGVSVGKKQAKLTQEANLGRSPQVEQIRRPKPKPPQEAEPSAIDKEIASHAKQESVPGKPTDKSLTALGERGTKPGAKATTAQDKTVAKPGLSVGTPAAQPKTEAAVKAPGAKPATAAQKQPVAAKHTPPVKTTTVPQAKPAAPPVKGLYYVQLAAFDEKKAAVEYVGDIKAAGFSTIIMDPLATDKKPWFRVRIGGYASKEDAQQAVLRLKSLLNKKRFEYWITRD